MLDSFAVRALLISFAYSVCGLALVACQAALPVRLENETFDILEEVRVAMGAPALFEAREGLTLRGVREMETASGATSRPISVSCKPTGSFLLSIGGEVGASTRGFDGSDVWTRDTRGVVRRLGLGSRGAVLLDGQLRTFLWLRPGSEERIIEVVEGDSTDQRIALDVSHPTDPIAARVWIDRATMRLDSFEMNRLGRTRTVRFDDWSQENGLWLPLLVTELLDGELRHVDRFGARSAGTPSTFSAPRPTLPDDTIFEGRLDRPVTLPTRVDSGGRFYVNAAIGEGQSGWFLLDTGFGSHAIAEGHAARFGMMPLGTATLAGVGGAKASAWQMAGRVTVGPAAMLNQRFATLEGQFLTDRAGFDVHGVLGAPLFERLGVVLDERSGNASLFQPFRFRPRGVDWYPVAQDGSAPCIQGSVTSGRSRTPGLWLRLDTGSDDSVTVSRWAVDTYSLIDRTRPLRPTSLRGLFGELQGWRVRLGALEFCGVRQRDLDATLLREESDGPLADPWIGGNLGMGALRGRRVIIDLAHGQIAVSGSGS